MSPDEYRTHQINLLASRAIDTAMAYGHAERNHGSGEDDYRAIAQDRLDKLTAIINELRDLALTDTALQERLVEQMYEVSQVHEDNRRLSRKLAAARPPAMPMMPCADVSTDVPHWAHVNDGAACNGVLPHSVPLDSAFMDTKGG